jgi:hypothetical protein
MQPNKFFQRIAKSVPAEEWRWAYEETRMRTDQSLLDEFEKLADDLLSRESTIKKTLKRAESKIVLEIPRGSNRGFDVGATVETYGIYPYAGECHGAAWERLSDWTAKDVCKDFFGLVRSLLCCDSQLRYIYRHGRITKAQIYLRAIGGWHLFDETRFVVFPYGETRQEICENNHLQPRFPYENLKPTGVGGVYHW